MQKNIKSKIETKYSKEIIDILNFISDIAHKEKVKVFLVGGMVRDLLLDMPNIDLDITVEGMSGIKFAKKIANSLNKNVLIDAYPLFKTATLSKFKDFKIDIATCRSEKYLFSGSLPIVKEATIKDDLYRRDFTINALAVSLNRDSFGKVLDFFDGIKDLYNREIKVIHDKSFIDDPTRIIRGIRFAARLDFKFEKHTCNLLKEAFNKDVFKNVSIDRIKQEIKLMLEEGDVFKQLDFLNRYIGTDFLNLKVELTPEKKELFQKVKHNYFKLIDKKEFKNLELWLINFLVLIDQVSFNDCISLCKKFNFTNDEKKKIQTYKNSKNKISGFLNDVANLRKSQVFDFLKNISIEGVVLILSKCRNKKEELPILNFLLKDRFIQLELNGNDLKNLGVSSGPNFSKLLTEILYAKIDGKIKNKSDEIKFAKELI